MGSFKVHQDLPDLSLLLGTASTFDLDDVRHIPKEKCETVTCNLSMSEVIIPLRGLSFQEVLVCPLVWIRMVRVKITSKNDIKLSMPQGH